MSDTDSKYLHMAIEALGTQCLYESGHMRTPCDPPAKVCSVCAKAFPIAAALRRAANEAAYRGFDIGAQLEQGESWDDCDDEMTSEFGPRPKEARDE